MRIQNLHWPVLFGAVGLLAQDQSRKSKPISEWTETDIKQILTDSPWTRRVTPEVEKQPPSQPASRGGMNRSGVSVGGIRIGGLGGPRTGGRGGASPAPSEGDGGTGGGAPTLTVRWESAVPVQAAHLKAGDSSALTIDEGSYTIAVIGLPARIASGDPQTLESRLKNQGELKREGQRTVHSSQARVLSRDEGIMVLFTFPKSMEITRRDEQVEFDAQIGSLKLTQKFTLADMVYADKLEL
ncbi:MAG: hypothetical protein JWO19_3761 [Bryobacterales bacterium]|jgi:hypothetical protein|nr:hypothetical protein [Bryobacterales bacterium]